MAKQDLYKECIEDIKSGTEGLYAVSVVEIASGLALGTFTDGTLDPEIASAHNVEVVKSKLKAIDALGLKEKIDDILITLTYQYHLINCNDEGTHMIYVAASRTKANLAILRNLARNAVKKLDSGLAS